MKKTFMYIIKKGFMDSQGKRKRVSSSLNSQATQKGSDDCVPVRSSSYFDDVAMGFHASSTIWNKFGRNEDVDTGIAELIATWGGDGGFSPLAAALPLDISSSSASDTDGGVGAHGVVVYGVDADYKEQTRVYLLNGTLTVVTPESWLGVNRVVVFRAGSSQQNIGTITVAAGINVQARIDPGEGTSFGAIYFVPAGKTALIHYIRMGALRISGGGASPRVLFEMKVLAALSNCVYTVVHEDIDTDVTNEAVINSEVPLVVDERQCIYWLATTTADNTHADLRMSIVVRNKT